MREDGSTDGGANTHEGRRGMREVVGGLTCTRCKWEYHRKIRPIRSRHECLRESQDLHGSWERRPHHVPWTRGWSGDGDGISSRRSMGSIRRYA